MLDTLETTRRLTEAGMETRHAETLATILQESADRRVTPELLADALEKLGTRLDARIDQVETRLNARIDQLDAKVEAKADFVIQQARADLHRGLLWLGGVLATLWAATFFAGG